MTLASLEFLIFFALTLLLYVCVSPSLRRWVLLFASVAFVWSTGTLAVVLVSATALIDFFVGRRIGHIEHDGRRRRLLFASLLWNLGTLGYFKYAHFALENIEGGFDIFGVDLSLPHPEVSIPAGISYFTFSSLSYILDVYYGRQQPSKHLLDYFLYVAYFPKFLAGPIARTGSFLPQMRDQARPTDADIETGAALILAGVVKKAVIADQLAPHVDLIFATPGQYDGFTLFQGALGYAIQIYFDFSGYSDMAIGCARMFGVRLPQNFSLPYSASSITEFWRRWHITLSGWFRDYVFLPLEVSTRRIRRADLRGSMNLLITMLLCGLWHGASWNFIIWGGLHGVALAVNRVWSSHWSNRQLVQSASVRFGWSVLSHVATLSVVLLGWVFFRTASLSEAVHYVAGILTWQQGLHLPSPQIMAAIFLTAVAHLVIPKDWDWAETMPRRTLPARVIAYASMLFLVTTLGNSETAPFLYFQF